MYKILNSWNKIHTRLLTWNCYKIPSRISFKIHAWVTENLGEIPKTISIQIFLCSWQDFPPRISPRSPPGFSSKFLPWISSKILSKMLAGILDTSCKILSDSWHRFFQDLVLDSVKTWIASNWTKNIHITLDWFDRH